MNTFVRLVRLEDWSFRHIQYFSVRVEGEGQSLFHDFMERMDKVKDEEVLKELDQVLNWVEYLGEEEQYALRNGFFRHEGRDSDAKALPPNMSKVKATKNRASKDDADWMDAGQMRLYCHAASDNVVFLFNGDMKTPGTREARECEKVRPHFDMANRITRALNQAFKDKDIEWRNDHTDIEYANALRIEL